MAIETVDSVSVVITAHNCACYLDQAIGSVLGQTRPPRQVILLDDGSSDDCAAVANDYGDAVEYIFQPKSGIAAARNAGAARARLPWLAFIDGDDYWELDKLARQMAAAEAAPGRVAIFGHVQQFISPELALADRQKLRVPEALMPGVYAGTMLIRREAFDRVGPFQDAYMVGEFLDWYGRAVEMGLETFMLPERVCWRRVHLNNTSRSQGQGAALVRVLKTQLDRRRLKHGQKG